MRPAVRFQRKLPLRLHSWTSGRYCLLICVAHPHPALHLLPNRRSFQQTVSRRNPELIRWLAGYNTPYAHAKAFSGRFRTWRVRSRTRCRPLCRTEGFQNPFGRSRKTRRESAAWNAQKTTTAQESTGSSPAGRPARSSATNAHQKTVSYGRRPRLTVSA